MGIVDCYFCFLEEEFVVLVELAVVIDYETEHGEGGRDFIGFEGVGVVEYVFELLSVVDDFGEYFGQFYVFKHNKYKRNNVFFWHNAKQLLIDINEIEFWSWIDKNIYAVFVIRLLPDLSIHSLEIISFKTAHSHHKYYQRS